MPPKKVQHKPSKNFWITTGIFSSHYLLERLPQAGPKIWHPDEEVFSCSLKKYKNPDTLLHGWKN
jgi:hypothetical protein